MHEQKMLLFVLGCGWAVQVGRTPLHCAVPRATRNGDTKALQVLQDLLVAGVEMEAKDKVSHKDEDAM